MATAELERPARRSYTQEEIDTGLTVLAWCGGNTRLAAKKLAEHGTPIPRDTLRYWADSKKDDLQRVTERVLPQLEEKVAAGTEAIALSLIDLEAQAMERVQATIGELKPAEAAAALRNITTSKGINVDKALLLRGRPTSIVGKETDAEALLRSLSDLQPKAVDGTCVELSARVHPENAQASD